MRALTLLILCCAALALASCGRAKPPLTLVGKWRTPSGGQFEFRADGTVIRTLPFATFEDKYQLLDDGMPEIQETASPAVGQSDRFGDSRDPRTARNRRSI